MRSLVLVGFAMTLAAMAPGRLARAAWVCRSPRLGMTCSHCVNAVSREVGGLPGVTAVHVDLETGAVMVTSQKPLEADAVRDAVDEAGYELVG